ncbi:hypothetical protein LTR66_003974 [Elasticomyces elasticus]|nr:hypothetical protein LTR66_003974 [Elasticomyces elasticus]
MESSDEELSRMDIRSLICPDFLAELPLRDIVLEFLSDLRTKPDFLADRILALTQKELGLLTASQALTGAKSSVFERSEPVKASELYRRRLQHMSSASLDGMQTGQLRDVLSILMRGIYPTHIVPGSAEDCRRTNTLATVCARLVTQQKAGSDTFILSLLDAWSGLRRWTGKQRFEMYLMETIQEGIFILEKPDKQSFRVRTQLVDVQGENDQAAVERFYERAVRGLLALLDDQPGIIPPGALEMGHAIARKLVESPKHLNGMPYFMTARWLFSTFLLDAMTYPEARGMMLNFHISEVVRRRILEEIAIRAQKAMLGVIYNWKQIEQPPADVVTRVQGIMQRFKLSKNHQDRHPGHSQKPDAKLGNPDSLRSFVILQPSDIRALINTLLPERELDTGILKDATPSLSERSSASSVSGLSLFQRAWPDECRPMLGRSTSSLRRSESAAAADPHEENVSPRNRSEEPHDPSTRSRVLSGVHYEAQLRLASSQLEGMVDLKRCDLSDRTLQATFAKLLVEPDGSLSLPQCGSLPPGSDLRAREDMDLTLEPSIGTDFEVPEDYIGLRCAISKLLDHYGTTALGNAPENVPDHWSTTGTNNDDAGVDRDSQCYGRYNGRCTNPYRESQTSGGSNGNGPTTRSTPDMRTLAPNMYTLPGNHRYGEDEVTLNHLLDSAVADCQTRADFVSAHYYFKTLQRLQDLRSTSLSRDGYALLIHIFYKDFRTILIRWERDIADCEAWRPSLEYEQSRLNGVVAESIDRLRHLRDKMWYATDVGASSAYEEAKSVAVSLRSMGKPTKPYTNALTLDLMSASKGHGGPRKLADQQIHMTVQWMQHMHLENFCKGEERVHRLHLEISRCVDRLVQQDAVKNPELWSSSLYETERGLLKLDLHTENTEHTLRSSQSSVYDEYTLVHSKSTAQGSDAVPRSLRDLRTTSLASPSHHHSSSSSKNKFYQAADHNYFEDQSPTLTSKSSATFWSPLSPLPQSPSSATSIRLPNVPTAMGRKNPPRLYAISEREHFLARLKTNLTSLVMSDLGLLAFGEGTETDQWCNGKYGEQILQNMSQNKVPLMEVGLSSEPSLPHDSSSSESTQSGGMQKVVFDQHDDSDSKPPTVVSQSTRTFDYTTAYRTLLRTFEASPNPYSKLNALYELELLLSSSLQVPNVTTGSSHSNTLNNGGQLHGLHSNYDQRGELLTNVERSRQTDTLIEAFQVLLRKSDMRPRRLFRDLQYIASFVPSNILDKTARGKAFWNFGLAAMGLKVEVCKSMVLLADNIIAFHASNRGLRQDSSAAQKQRNTVAFASGGISQLDENLARYSMADAASLLQITAKEGDIAAQRELATLYLTHPDLMARVTMPLMASSDVFKTELESKWKTSEDPDRCDPLTMCVAHHWMELSSNGGDALAKKYLKAREDIEKIPS